MYPLQPVDVFLGLVVFHCGFWIGIRAFLTTQTSGQSIWITWPSPTLFPTTQSVAALSAGGRANASAPTPPPPAVDSPLAVATCFVCSIPIGPNTVPQVATDSKKAPVLHQNRVALLACQLYPLALHWYQIFVGRVTLTRLYWRLRGLPRGICLLSTVRHPAYHKSELATDESGTTFCTP